MYTLSDVYIIYGGQNILFMVADRIKDNIHMGLKYSIYKCYILIRIMTQFLRPLFAHTLNLGKTGTLYVPIRLLFRANIVAHTRIFITCNIAQKPINISNLTKNKKDTKILNLKLRNMYQTINKYL